MISSILASEFAVTATYRFQVHRHQRPKSSVSAIDLWRGAYGFVVGRLWICGRALIDLWWGVFVVVAGHQFLNFKTRRHMSIARAFEWYILLSCNSKQGTQSLQPSWPNQMCFSFQGNFLTFKTRRGKLLSLFLLLVHFLGKKCLSNKLAALWEQQGSFTT